MYFYFLSQSQLYINIDFRLIQQVSTRKFIFLQIRGKKKGGYEPPSQKLSLKLCELTIALYVFLFSYDS